jgi:hypothetical protein
MKKKAKPTSARTRKKSDTMLQAEEFDALGYQVRDKRISALRKFLKKEGFTQIGSGCTRITFGKPRVDYVIKLPLSSSYNNVNEVKFAKNPKKGIKVAKCSLEILKGVPVVKMERVKPLVEPRFYGSDRAERAIQRIQKSGERWITKVDCCQVGRTKDGRIVAFDVGNF